MDTQSPIYLEEVIEKLIQDMCKEIDDLRKKLQEKEEIVNALIKLQDKKVFVV